MIIDVALDMRQAVKYHKLSVKHEEVSTAYFKTSVVIFFLPPLLLALFSVVYGIYTHHDAHYRSVTKIFLQSCNIKFESKYGGNWFVILCHPIIFIFDYLFLFFCGYIVLPLMFLVIGVKVLFGVKIDPDEDIFKILNFSPVSPSRKNLPFFLLFENIGEALPQLTLSLIFLAKSYPILLISDTLFGIPIPISLVTSIFSFGSLCMGFYSGCKACKARYTPVARHVR